MRFHPSKLRSSNHQSAARTLIIGKFKTVVQNEQFRISATLVGVLGELRDYFCETCLVSLNQ